jgi:hypothetical protein
MSRALRYLIRHGKRSEMNDAWRAQLSVSSVRRFDNPLLHFPTSCSPKPHALLEYSQTKLESNSSMSLLVPFLTLRQAMSKAKRVGVSSK